MALRFFDRPDRLAITTHYSDRGIQFQLSVREGGKVEPVLLPLGADIRRFIGQAEAERLALLDSLWEEEVLTESEEAGPGHYLLPTEAVYELDSIDRRVLRIPEPEPLQVSLQTVGAMGSRRFEIQARVRHPKHGMLHQYARRTGPFFVLPSGEAVMATPEVTRLLDEIEVLPQKPMDQPEYLARVKAAAEAAGADLDSYLAREEVHLVSDVELEPKLVAPDHLVLIPVLPELPVELAQEVHPQLNTVPAYLPVEHQGKQKRVFLSDRAQRILRQWQNRPEVRGSDVARLLRNPAPFLPEEIDLAKFSERVKGIKLRVYRAHPYLAAQPVARGWFEFRPSCQLEEVDVPRNDELTASADAEIPINGERGTGDLPQLSLEQLKKLAEEAGDDGYAYVPGLGWVEIPKSASDFIAASQELLEMSPEGRFDRTQLSYVLDIFTNIEDLGYSEELLEEREAILADESGEEPAGFNGTLQPHQREGLSWLKRLRRLGLGGLLADDMGLGKTIQVLAFMAYLHERGELRPSLVVLPRAVWENWQAEVYRFCPGLRLYTHGGPGRTRSPHFLSQWDVVLTTYETLTRDQFFMGQVDWRLVVCDEAQKIKNMTALATSAAKALKASMRVAMTGTPVENNLGELWCIVDFAQPGLLGSYRQFRQQYEKPLKSGDPKTMRRVERDLAWRLRPIYKRRTKEEHLKNLELEHDYRYVPMSSRQEQLYVDILERARGKKGTALGALQLLLQVCSHPALVDGSWWHKKPKELVQEAPKLEETIHILDRIRGWEEKALVVTHWRDMQQILQRVILERYRIHAKIINGESVNRKSLGDQFAAHPGFNVLIISPKAGGVGLNLVGANHVIHYSRWWNPAVEKQATDRVFRIGQTKNVTAYYPIVTHPSSRTVEVILNQLLSEKRELAERVIIPSSMLDVSTELAAQLGLVH